MRFILHVGIAPLVTSARATISQHSQPAQETFEMKADNVSINSYNHPYHMSVVLGEDEKIKHAFP